MGAIPLVRLDHSDPQLFAELIAAVERTARRAAFVLGEEVARFERDAAYCGVTDAVGLSSGTESLVLALRAIGAGAGDEVILPANTFIATAEAVAIVGATPRLVDVDPVTHLITADAVERALSRRTRCDPGAPVWQDG